MFAAGCGAICFVYQDVIVASGTDHAVNRFAELVVGAAGGVFAARLFAADGHIRAPMRQRGHSNRSVVAGRTLQDGTGPELNTASYVIAIGGTSVLLES